MPEYSIPIMFDVTAPDREAAGRAVVEILARHWKGTEQYGGGPRWSLDHTQQVRVESWWTIEEQDKKHDRNDNDPGEVVFSSRRRHHYLGHPLGVLNGAGRCTHKPSPEVPMCLATPEEHLWPDERGDVDV